MPRPPIKKTMKLAEAQRTGELKAELKMHKKKPLDESLREHIGKFIDRIQIDPLETAAIIGTMVIIKPVIHTAIEAGKITTDAIKFWLDWFTPYGVIEGAWQLIIGKTAGTGTENPYPQYIPGPNIHGGGGIPYGGTTPTFIENPSWVQWNKDHIEGKVTSQVVPFTDVMKSANIGEWIVAFVVAFCLIRWGPAIINSSFNGVLDIVNLMKVAP